MFDHSQLCVAQHRSASATSTRPLDEGCRTKEGGQGEERTKNKGTVIVRLSRCYRPPLSERKRAMCKGKEGRDALFALCMRLLSTDLALTSRFLSSTC